MPRNAEQKIKLLVLYDILLRKTDENHPMTTNELVAALRECGIEVSRKTIYEDIDILIRYGYDIVCIKSRNNQYFVGEHGFERPEIELLLNAVSTSKLLTQTKSKVLSDKLAELLGKPQGEELKSTVGAVSAKNRNEHVYYAIDAITDALLKKHKLSFLYFDRTPRGEKQYRKNGERYEVNDRLKVYVKNIKNGSRGAQVLVSRSSVGLVKRLFENEVPEIKSGAVVVKAITREAGQRTKMAICSEDAQVDAVGACVGNKGSRVNAVVAELGGEKVDIIQWSENPLEFIAKALSPAKVISVTEVGEKSAIAVVPDDKLSLAIGRDGQNARLAARLTGWKIDVKSESAAARMEELRRAEEEPDEAEEAAEEPAEE